MWHNVLRDVTIYFERAPSITWYRKLLTRLYAGGKRMLPIAESEEGATGQVSASASRYRRVRDRVVTAEMRAVRRRRGWTVVGSETRWVLLTPVDVAIRVDNSILEYFDNKVG